jgi:hypothetical protein
VAAKAKIVEEMELLGEEIAKVSVHLTAATHRLLKLIREFDAGGGWHYQGAISCAHWLSWRIGLEPVAAREHVRVARRLGELRKIDEELRSGRMSYSKVRALTRVATPETEDEFIETARCSTAAQLEKICRHYRSALRMNKKTPLEHAIEEDARYVRVRELSTGMVKFEALLHAEEADLVMRAINAARFTKEQPESNAQATTNAAAADDIKTNADEAQAETNAKANTNVDRDGNGNANEQAKQPTDPQIETAEEPGSVAADAPTVEERSDLGASAPIEDDFLSADQRAIRELHEQSRRLEAEMLRDPDVRADSEPPRPKAKKKASAETHPSREERQVAQSKADALLRIAESFLANGPRERAGGARTQVVVHVDIGILAKLKTEGRCQLEDGTPIAPETARRLACDASILRIIEDGEGNPLHVGRKTRTISPALRRAMESKGRHCSFPGCTNVHFIENHHAKHWADGGETSIKNLAPLCRHHHHLVHEEGYTINIQTNGEPEFIHPTRGKIEQVPPLPTIEGDAYRDLIKQLDDEGLDLDPNAQKPAGSGEVDYSFVGDLLQWVRPGG